jgi:hypothetical protein
LSARSSVRSIASSRAAAPPEGGPADRVRARFAVARERRAVFLLAGLLDFIVVLP